jgi:glucose-6-phosphate 1-dehydrogenase
MIDAVPTGGAAWAELVKGFRYVSGDYGGADTMARLKGVLEEIDAERGTAGNRMFYLATVPAVFEPVADALGGAGLNHPPREGAFARLIIEKPFGRDLATARQLDAALHRNFGETQIYRIDHYLGKEAVQNLLALRFGNSLFEPLWRREWVESIQITVAEELGVEGRGNFYDQTGALRDMVQNHLLQLLSIIAMEPPHSMDADAVRDEKLRVLRALKPVTSEQIRQSVVRGQYHAGAIKGVSVPAYQAEAGVGEHSMTETFVALKA